MKKRIDYALVGDWLRNILANDGWTVRAGTDKCIYSAVQNRRRIDFFFSDQPRRTVTAAFRKIQRDDRDQFKHLGVLIAPTTAAMQQLREARQARNFPRAFFASIEEIRDAAAGRTPVMEEQPNGVKSFTADILANAAIGWPEPSHYRLVFRAPALQELQPPQFLMMDTTPTRAPLGARSVRRRWNLAEALDLAPRPLLKRPFGIYRALHRDFAGDYLKRLRLPPSLALVLHAGYADHFDMLYKVLPNGIGTPLMAKLKRGQKVHMLGPLGQPFDVRRLRAEGVEEVHIIGGGVGMAPLIVLIEALRFYSFPVKVFLGIATLESLRYRDELAATFGEKSTDAYIYIDELLNAGIAPADLYVSFDRAAPANRVRGIPRSNLHHGLVPDQYRQFLQTRSAGKDVIAFTCGPNRMMEAVAEIAGQTGVRLKVLLEKRMGCGIGVCFSCVQNVRRPDGTDDYARVCTEGPIFDASDILWKTNDSKQPSANSSCAVRC